MPGRATSPAIARERQCRKCGADEWRRNNQGKFYCNPCALRRSGQWRASNKARTLWQSAKQRAKKSGLAFTITENDVRGVWPVNGLCPVLGITLARVPGKGGIYASSPTLDRIDNTRGYEPGNIAVISGRANTIKSTGTAQEHEAIARWMWLHHLT